MRAIVRTCELSHSTIIASQVHEQNWHHPIHPSARICGLMRCDAMRCDCTSTRLARLSPTIHMHIVHPLVHVPTSRPRPTCIFGHRSFPFWIWICGWKMGGGTPVPNLSPTVCQCLVPRQTTWASIPPFSFTACRRRPARRTNHNKRIAYVVGDICCEYWSRM